MLEGSSQRTSLYARWRIVRAASTTVFIKCTLSAALPIACISPLDGLGSIREGLRNWTRGATITPEPERACQIIKRLTPENGTRAAGYALDALGKSAAPPLFYDLLEDVVARGFDNSEFRGSAARGVEKLVRRKETIPTDIIDILEAWLAQVPPQAAGEETVSAEADNTEIDTGIDDGRAKTDREHESLVWGYGGFAIAPDGDYPILETLIHARLVRGESDRLLESLSRYADRNPDAQIWESLLRFVPFIRPTGPEMLSVFNRKLFESVPKLVGTKGPAQFLAKHDWEAPDLSSDVLTRWRDAETVPARMAYGEIITIAALLHPQLGWPAERLAELLDDTALADARVGAAHSAVNIWVNAKHRSAANHILLRLLETGPEDIWNAVFDLFRLAEDLSPDEPTVTLLTAIADRIAGAPKVDATFAVERLAGLLPHQAQVVGRLSRALVEHLRDELGDIRTSSAMAATDLVNIAVTLHRLGPETRDLGTTLFELLLEIESYAALETLEELDSRFPDRPVMPRRRLLRRTQRRARGRRTKSPAAD